MHLSPVVCIGRWTILDGRITPFLCHRANGPNLSWSRTDQSALLPALPNKGRSRFDMHVCVCADLAINDMWNPSNQNGKRRIEWLRSSLGLGLKILVTCRLLL